jgi:hypothetical protein
MADKKDEKRKVDAPPFFGKLTLERNEHGLLVPMVAGIAIEGVIGVTYHMTQQSISLSLYFDPSDVVFATKHGESPSVH